MIYDGNISIYIISIECSGPLFVKLLEAIK
jgi:hypothetical protein